MADTTTSNLAQLYAIQQLQEKQSSSNLWKWIFGIIIVIVVIALVIGIIYGISGASNTKKENKTPSGSGGTGSGNKQNKTPSGSGSGKNTPKTVSRDVQVSNIQPIP